MIKKLLFFWLLSCSLTDLQAVVAVGDTPGAPTTFSFSVGSAIYDSSSNQRLWALSGQDLSSFPLNIQSYGISYTSFISIDGSLSSTLTSYPYLPTQAIVTTTDGDGDLIAPGAAVANPLLGQDYSALAFLGNNLVVVNSLNNQYIYLIQSVVFNDGAFGITSPDGLSVVNLLDLGAGNQAKVLAGSGLGILFIAQAQGIFGTDSSEISFAKTATTPALVNGQDTTCVTIVEQADLPVTLTTPVLTAGGNALQTIGSSIAMFPLELAGQMYIGLDVSSAAAAGSQAVGLFMATAVLEALTTSASINFSSVLPDPIASQGKQTPVSAPQNHRVAVSNITSTTTSTGLSYFITSRYDGVGKQSVYAMPMVTKSSISSQNGTIANYNSIAQTFKIVASTYRVQGFNLPIGTNSDGTLDATQVDQIDINSTDPEVIARLQVGSGTIPLNPGQFIDQLVAQGDAVYITIQTPFGAGATPGMFKSQALFDPTGKIMSWSPWQRVAGSDAQMIFAIKNGMTDATMYVTDPSAGTSSIVQTTWNSTTDLTSFIGAINAAMPQINGGVQNIIAVSDLTTDLTGFPLVIATGNQAVVIAQTGEVSGGNLVIASPTQNTVTIDSSFGLNIGSIVTAAFANDSVSGNNWFFMGGDNGLAVLSNDTTGVGFNDQLTSFAQLITGMTCKTLGSFKFVKKVAADNDFLYVMTLNAVYRVALDATKFTSATPAALATQLVVSASTIDRFASCTDMLIDNNLMLLGTTAGFYSLDVSGGLPATPVLIAIPQGLSTVSRLTTISSNTNAPNTDQNFYASSNLYALTIDYATQQARLNRFTITNGVVAPIQDQLLQGQNGPLLIFDYMSNNIFIDGSLGFATSYRIGSIPPAVKYLQYSLQAGRSSNQTLLRGSTANLSIASVLNSVGLAGIARDYASGCLMLAADFGLLTDS